jgi:hypothetical protein
MGRFYKTAKPNMIDFMYQVPEQAILGAIKGADAQLEKQDQYITDFQKQLQHKALSPDVARQQELLKQYEDEIKQYALVRDTSPLEALKQRQAIRQLGNRIYEDVTRGELAAQYSNYAIRQKHLEEETKRATNADGTIDEADLAEAMAEWDRRYAAEKRDEVTGELIQKGGVNYDPTTGKYRTYGTEKLYDFYNRKKEFEKIAEGWEPSTDTDVTTEKLVGNYYVTTREKDRLLPTDELTWGIYNTMLYDPKAINYNTQKARIKGGGEKKGYEREWSRLFGEREEPGNPFSKFKMEEVKDAEGKIMTQKVKKMKDGKVIEEEVPVMRMVNPGELFMAAQTAAGKKDINQIVRSTTLDLSEAAEIELQKNKEIAVAKAKKAIEDPIVTIDTTGQTVAQKTSGSTISEAFKNLTASYEGLQLMKDELKGTYANEIQNTLNANPSKFGATAIERKQNKELIDDYINNGDYAGLEKFLQGKGIELPGTMEAARILNETQRSLGNNERVVSAIKTKVMNTPEYQDQKTYLKTKYAAIRLINPELADEMMQKDLDTYIDDYAAANKLNQVTQTVKNVQGTEWTKNNIATKDEVAELNEGLNYIKKNPFEFLSSLSSATNAVVNKVDTKGNVVQTYTSFVDLLASKKISLDQVVEQTEDKDVVKLVYKMPNSKDKLAVIINKVDLIDGDVSNFQVKTSKGKTEQIDLGLLPINANLQLVTIKPDGTSQPENVNIITSRDNVKINKIENVVNNNSKIQASAYVQQQVNNAQGQFEGLGKGKNNYIEDQYGVIYYPNELQGTARGKVIIYDKGKIIEGYGQDGIQLWQNYILTK